MRWPARAGPADVVHAFCSSSTLPNSQLSIVRLSVRAQEESAAAPGERASKRQSRTSIRRLVLTFRSLSDQWHASLTRERLLAQVAGFFGAIALLLAALGLYRRDRVHRVAPPAANSAFASPSALRLSQVIRLVLARTSLLVAAGILAGTAVSVWGSTFVAGLIYGVPAADPLTLAGAASPAGGDGRRGELGAGAAGRSNKYGHFAARELKLEGESQVMVPAAGHGMHRDNAAYYDQAVFELPSATVNH